MKRFFVVLFLCFAFTLLNAQKEPTRKAQKAQKVQAMQTSAAKNEGNKALAMKDYKTALAKFESVLAATSGQPADYAMIYSMGTCAYNLNDMPKSLKYFEMCLAAGQNTDMAYQYKACIMKAQKNNADYLKVLKEGLAKVPNSSGLKGMLGTYYCEEGDKCYHKALETMKSASAMVKSGKVSSADKAFKELNDRARIDFKECLKWVDMSLQMNPNDVNAKNLKKNCSTQLQMLI